MVTVRSSTDARGAPGGFGRAAARQGSGDRPGGRRAWSIFAVGVVVYIFTVLQRTSLGAAGLDAAHRFGIGAGTLSLFVFLQVAVFVVAQIPAGLLVDRFGPRLMLTVSAGLLGVGQLALGTFASLALAVPARVLVGAGDAIMFASVMAVIPLWFAAHRVPLLAQLITILGQLGQVLSAIPFATLLHSSGWSPAFFTAGAASALVAVLAFLVVRNGPAGSWRPSAAGSAGEIFGKLREVWHRPGTRLGFFGHMGTQFSMMVFGLLWGVPYLVSGQGLTAGRAGAMIGLFVVCTIAIGPVIGMLTARHPLRRSWLLLGVIAIQAGTWTAVLSLSGPAPHWLLILLVVALASGGPGSVVGIDIARTTNPGHSLGLAQCMVNLGGFLATLLVLAAMGLLINAGGGFTPTAFRHAWLVQYVIWGVAVTGILVCRRQARRVDARRGVAPRPLRQVFAGAHSR